MENEDIKIQEFLTQISKIVSRLKALRIDQFKNRISNLQHNIDNFAVHKVKSGLVGITSSGKSSVLNVILGAGTKILKEQSKATTNMLVFCSKAREPEMEIMFEDGNSLKKKGREAFDKSIWKYTSEDENPGNKFGVKYLKLGLPTFMMDDNIELADTPGLDAYGLKEHEDLTLREFLPQADLIIYLSSIRSPMKEADRKILNKIMDADQKIVFVQTCKGAVVEGDLSRDGVESVDKLLEKYKAEFEKLISPYSRLKDAPIVQVETTMAGRYFKDNNKAAWEQSGFEELVLVIRSVAKQLQFEYTLKNLKKVVDEVNSLITLLLSAIKEEAGKKNSIDEQAEKLDKLKKYAAKIKHTKDQVVSLWKQKLDTNVMFNEFQHELSRVYSFRYDFNPMHDTEFIMKARAIGEKMQSVKANMLDNLDNAKERFKECFDDVGLDVRRTDIQSGSVKSFYLPNVQKRRMSTSKAGGVSTESLLGKGREVSFEYIDKSRFIEDLRESLEMFLKPLVGHLQWWDNTMSFSFVDPIEHKISSIEDDIASIERGGSYNDEQSKLLVAISKELHGSVKEVSYLFDVDVMEQKFPVYTKKSHFRKEKAGFVNLFLQLCSRFYESLFHNYYIRKLSQYSTERNKSVILISPAPETQFSFLNRLLRLQPDAAHRLHTLTPPYVLNPRRAGMDIPTHMIDGEFSDWLTFYVLGNDEASLSAAKSNDLFQRADVIQPMIDDLHRVGSALVDIVERNLFFDLMKGQQKKLLLTYPGGAHFQKDRLHIMVDEAIPEVNKVFKTTYAQWFIYESYEVRYSYFYELVSTMTHENVQPEECLQKWTNMGIPLDEPFTQEILLEQFAELF
ncbi:dynamin family protein [Candidatus Magnetobacterium casense]|uniref:Dynamin family protein n=1 Tax=Candidatus Magnetobacterium casense TaxID=1455061 RepID=A0ABS6RW24_9BACT|nr:dynamin family protein [Candidatus Magnetobacterium casensis]MBV6340834.1 dynamin family protein [Candidatus Magnetobacterium casensis]